MNDKELVKCECWDCGKQFIIGKQSLESCPPGYPVCSYCGQSNTEEIAWDDRAIKNMGRMTIRLFAKGNKALSGRARN